MKRPTPPSSIAASVSITSSADRAAARVPTEFAFPDVAVMALASREDRQLA
jgi:hypothetical protein